MKEGDTPSFLYVLSNGLSDPEHPEWGNWGGRFRSSGYANEFIPAEDIMDGALDLLYSIHRWRTAYQNAFEARMDWCVQPYVQANHEPTAVCNGDRTRRRARDRDEARRLVNVSAVGSTDPDGDALEYRWWVYREAGSYWADAPIRDAGKASAVLTVPKEASGRTIHVILEVTDTGKPPLVAYRRVILKVSGMPVEPPAGTIGVEEDLTEPITRLEAPSAKTGTWTFWRGVNINGPSIEIDGNRWDGDDAPHFVCENNPLNSPQVALIPPTDEVRARMIHSFRWGREFKLQLLRVPRGTYAVYAYVWEETDPGDDPHSAERAAWSSATTTLDWQAAGAVWARGSPMSIAETSRSFPSGAPPTSAASRFGDEPAHQNDCRCLRRAMLRKSDVKGGRSAV